jgi:riboflavin synthase alpha subunit
MIPPLGAKTFTSGLADLAHALRRRADAILTGARGPSGRRSRCSPCAGSADPRRKRRVLVVLDRRGPPAAGIPAGRRRAGPRPAHRDRSRGALLTDLAADGALEVLVEAGPTPAAGLARRRSLGRARDHSSTPKSIGVPTGRGPTRPQLPTWEETRCFPESLNRPSARSPPSRGRRRRLAAADARHRFYRPGELGESVAVNGVCLTVVRHDDQGQAEDFSSAPRPWRAPIWRSPSRAPDLNLERSLRPWPPASPDIWCRGMSMARRGCRGRSTTAARGECACRPCRRRLRGYCVEKGSIALNGVSLTLNNVEPAGRSGPVRRRRNPDPPHLGPHQPSARPIGDGDQRRGRRSRQICGAAMSAPI